MTATPPAAAPQEEGVEVELVEVAQVETIMERTFVESVLTEAGIEFVAQGGMLEATAFPVNQRVSIQVPESDAERAREVLSCITNEVEVDELPPDEEE